jgi:hypothetical protein
MAQNLNQFEQMQVDPPPAPAPAQDPEAVFQAAVERAADLAATQIQNQLNAQNTRLQQQSEQIVALQRAANVQPAAAGAVSPNQLDLEALRKFLKMKPPIFSGLERRDRDNLGFVDQWSQKIKSIMVI